LPLLGDLLSVPVDSRYPALDLTPQRKKERTFEALLRQLSGLARCEPVLMICEDLHRADPTSRELLDLTVEQLERLPVLLLATFRPEYQPPWTGQPHVTTLSLRRLGRHESDELVRGIIGNAAALPSDIMAEIVERTDGVPLFLEELTKAVVENAVIGSVPAASLAVPATLHGSLMARLDRLGSAAKEVAQIGACIGREFSYELLAAVAQRSETVLQDALGRLLDAGLVFQRGVPPQMTLLFKHALVQDIAYSTLLRCPRQALRASERKAHAHCARRRRGHHLELCGNRTCWPPPAAGQEAPCSIASPAAPRSPPVRATPCCMTRNWRLGYDRREPLVRRHQDGAATDRGEILRRAAHRLFV